MEINDVPVETYSLSELLALKQARKVRRAVWTSCCVYVLGGAFVWLCMVMLNIFLCILLSSLYMCGSLILITLVMVMILL